MMASQGSSAHGLKELTKHIKHVLNELGSMRYMPLGTPLLARLYLGF